MFITEQLECRIDPIAVSSIKVGSSTLLFSNNSLKEVNNSSICFISKII
ncbi:hypothetical protein DSOL_4304 [Desulfosporosinus metallidurans]|uniref:Uncharacterized protein n=1 Tax=Desulfosporosinus metallidurans TaxID=1888891 RepID=A0A1Q8QKT4_9FIRM|nr:hypothetical protein DSOL_4304 [Desulfosporosinus metallidurans]